MKKIIHCVNLEDPILLKLRSLDSSCPFFLSGFGDNELKCSKCYDRKAKIAFGTSKCCNRSWTKQRVNFRCYYCLEKTAWTPYLRSSGFSRHGCLALRHTQGFLTQIGCNFQWHRCHLLETLLNGLRPPSNVTRFVTIPGLPPIREGAGIHAMHCR